MEENGGGFDCGAFSCLAYLGGAMNDEDEEEDSEEDEVRDFLENVLDSLDLKPYLLGILSVLRITHTAEYSAAREKNLGKDKPEPTGALRWIRAIAAPAVTVLAGAVLPVGAYRTYLSQRPYEPSPEV